MPANITALVHEYKQSQNIAHDVLVVEHQPKPDVPARISLMIYGKEGTAVVTLERGNHWRVTNVQHDYHYRTAKWPDGAIAEPTNEGALDLIAGLIDCAVKHDGAKH